MFKKYNPRTTKAHKLDLYFYEKDDGFRTGGDDEIGCGTLEKTLKLESGWTFECRVQTTIGGNIVWVDLDPYCYYRPQVL